MRALAGRAAPLRAGRRQRPHHRRHRRRQGSRSPARCTSSSSPAASVRRRRLPRPAADADRSRSCSATSVARSPMPPLARPGPLRAGRRGHRLSRSRRRAAARRAGASCCVWSSRSRWSASGRTSSVPIRARVVASAVRRHRAGGRDGRFRMDLYHRLRVLPLRVPPLRERTGDLPVLVRRLHRPRLAEASRPPGARADARCARALAGYDWPGNVRELASRARARGDGGRRRRSTAADLPPTLVPRRSGRSRRPAQRARRSTTSSAATSPSSCGDAEAIRAAPPRCSGSAARRCGRSGSVTG